MKPKGGHMEHSYLSHLYPRASTGPLFQCTCLLEAYSALSWWKCHAWHWIWALTKSCFYCTSPFCSEHLIAVPQCPWLHHYQLPKQSASHPSPTLTMFKPHGLEEARCLGFTDQAYHTKRKTPTALLHQAHASILYSRYAHNPILVSPLLFYPIFSLHTHKRKRINAALLSWQNSNPYSLHQGWFVSPCANTVARRFPKPRNVNITL